MTKLASGEQLYNPIFRGAPTVTLSGQRVKAQFAGRTTLNSGSTSVTVSTAAVQSLAMISLTVQTGSMGTQSAGAIVVNSVVEGVSFALARNNNVAAQWNDTVMWMIWST